MQDLIDELSRRKKQAIAVTADMIMLPIALWSAFALRLGEYAPDVAPYWPAFVICVCVAIPVFGRLGLYRQVIRYMGNHAMLAILAGCTIAAVCIVIVPFMMRFDGFPRSVPAIFWMLALLYVGGTRFIVRAYIQRQQRSRNRRPVVIYGAGNKGVELARLLVQQNEYVPVAFIDQNKKLHRSSIDGVYVFPPKDLGQIISDSGVSEVFVAISRDPRGRREIIDHLADFSVRVRLIPDISELVTGQLTLANVRDVGIEDLLGRNEVEAIPDLLEKSVKGKTVLVTGAGGSIGSELCRQILRLRPNVVVLLDQSEYGLYQIERELSAIAEAESIVTPIVAVLGSVTDPALLSRTFERYQVETVYHAAAYKHVSLVENNVIQGIKNNTFGTLYCAQAAMDCGVNQFVLISTDKAVRTTSVMGASKRLAEMILQALQTESSDTQFSMVRFGNVLGSSGSVVPLFTEQINNGGPVTVTHPEVTRYFMSIPEAAQLVLQAGSMAQGGDVFLLDMGEPVKILDLAHRMIRLKGFSVKDELNPDGEIEVEYTGLKPGEKLYEELLVGEDVIGTEHRKIMRAEERFLPWSELRGALNTIEQACDTFDYEAIMTFIEGLVEGGDIEVQLGGLSRQDSKPSVVTLPTIKERATD
ncbi:MAG: nucleoside-diphosphate sugar epimerase/dehydratase [Pseudomonadota bacterium]